MHFNEKSDKIIISASEISAYYFCPVAWYLQRQGYKPTSILVKMGKKKHKKLGKILIKAEKQGRYATFLFYIGLVSLLFSLFLIMVL
jgi:hypothetical protein